MARDRGVHTRPTRVQWLIVEQVWQALIVEQVCTRMFAQVAHGTLYGVYFTFVHEHEHRSSEQARTRSGLSI